MMRFRLFAAAVVCTGLMAGSTLGQRQMEQIGRSVIAMRTSEGSAYVGWRMLGTDPEAVAFNLYRSTDDGAPIRLNSSPISSSTNYVDQDFDSAKRNVYFVRSVIDGKEGKASAPARISADSRTTGYVEVKLQTPEGYHPNDGSVGDLDGDGVYEIVIQQVGRGRDKSRGGMTTEPILDAYELDGTHLWRINLGRNIRDGAHYTQFMVYDLDGDGRAEVACKTADGTTDGLGQVIGDSTANHVEPEGAMRTFRNRRTGEARERSVTGYVLSGPEFLTVFDGLTGAALATVDYDPPRHPDTLTPTSEQMATIWGDGYGNRVDRFLACVAYLDGKRPSLVMCRGYYTRSVLAAWNFRGGELTHAWTFDSEDGTPGNKDYRGQGNHNLSVADVDGDGRDEIIYGAAVIDDDGTGLYSTGLGHGDPMHVSDLDPDRPGLEVFNIQERFADAGANLRDAGSGEVLWKKPSVKAGDDGEGPGRANSFNIDPRSRVVGERRTDRRRV